MASKSPTDEVCDEEELAEGFDEEIVAEELVGEEDVVADEGDEDAIPVALEEDEVVAEVPVVEEDEEVADADVELALDEVLAETIRRSTTIEEDDEVVSETDTVVDPAETILPKQDDEFRCASCRLLKKTSQLADQSKTLCRDCV
jgi:Domain of unknown function (DUF4193)